MSTPTRLRGGSVRVWFDPDDPLAVIERLALESTVVDGCLVFGGTATPDGYGKVHARGRQLYVHQLAADVLGVEGDGPCVLHSCDNPPCWHPGHLRRGSKLDNAHDAIARGRAWFQRSHRATT